MSKLPRVVSAADAVAKIGSGESIYISSSGSVPRVLVEALCARGRKGVLRNVFLRHIHTGRTEDYAAPEFEGVFRSESFFIGDNMRRQVQRGAADYIPVIATVGYGDDGDYNINADTAAAELAISLGAEKLILLTDVRGVLRDPKDDSTLIRQIRLEEVPSLLSSGVIGGGMIPKIQCCVNALEHGVHRTHILDGRIPHSILTEMLSHQGIGTMLWE